MNTRKFIELLREKINEANQNIVEIEKFRFVNERTFGYHAIYYDEEQVEIALNKLKQWQQVLQDILKAYYLSADHENYIRFCETIDRVKKGFDYKAELPKEYQKGITVLSGILESVELLGDEKVAQEVPHIMLKPKKIFISHSSKDKAFSHALILLLNSLGFGESDIFCSSEPGYWIKKGNFFKVIKEQFEQNDLYVIFIQSPRFYASSVSLNEMGAAWAMHSEYYSFLTKDMEYEKMNAVVNNHEIACKVDSKDAKDRLNDWQKELLNYFGKPMVTNVSIWERHRDEFLRKVRKMRYKAAELQEEKSEQPNNSARLTLEEREIMKQWVESNDDSMQYVAFIGGSGTLLLGNVQFEISTAQDKARWRSIFQHLSSCGMIENVGQENGFPKYILTEFAYKYFDNK